MRNDVQNLYDLCCTDLPALLPRSQLYPLEPVGVGTPYAESLTSYTIRLAYAHAVDVGTLIEKEILPHCARPYLTVPGSARVAVRGNFLLQSAHSLNGTQTWSSDWGDTLQALTLRDDLRFLTMLTWACVLNPLGLLRHTKAWCPACYEEWRMGGQVIYEPLLWMLAVVTTCPRHGQPLQFVCPHKNCQQSMPMLARGSRLGYCSCCGGWLGVPLEIASSDGIILATVELEWQTWVAGALGELIANAPSLPLSPQRQKIMEAVTAYAQAIAGGDLFVLSCLLEIDLPLLRSWQRGLKVPQLGSLLQVCYVLETTPLRFLTQCTEVAEIPLRTLSRVRKSLRTREKSVGPINSLDLRRHLEEILANDIEPALSLRQVSEKLGYSYMTMLRHYREQCHAISERYMAYRTARSQERKQMTRDRVRQTTFDLYVQGIYPTRHQIGVILHDRWIMYRPEAKDAWCMALKELGLSHQHADD